MSAKRVSVEDFRAVFPTYDTVKQNLPVAAGWIVLNVRGKLLDDAFDGGNTLVSEFCAWVDENCTGRYYLAYWLPEMDNDQATLVVCMEDPTSAMNVRMRWT
jgi:hypothetical protein